MRMLLVLWSAESEGRLKLHGLNPRLSAGLELRDASYAGISASGGREPEFSTRCAIISRRR